MKLLRPIIFLVCAIIASTAWALDLSEAKNMGLVGETPQGYIAAIGTPDDATSELIEAVNEKRRARYTSIAQDNGAQVGAVELVAGETAIKKTKPGHYILQDEAWVRK